MPPGIHRAGHLGVRVQGLQGLGFRVCYKSIPRQNAQLRVLFVSAVSFGISLVKSLTKGDSLGSGSWRVLLYRMLDCSTP